MDDIMGAYDLGDGLAAFSFLARSWSDAGYETDEVTASSSELRRYETLYTTNVKCEEAKG
jgi:hypothetical protein